MTRCGTCDRTWTGLAEAHCAAEQSAVVPLTVWDGDPGVVSKRYAELHERPVDAGGIPGQLLADLISAQAGAVQARRLDPPPGVPVFRSMVNGRQWTQVLWAVVGPVPVVVVNVLLGRDLSSEDPVLVGLDVLLDADSPAKPDVPLVAQVPLGLIRRDALAGSERPDRRGGVLAPARGASSSLAGALDGGPAADADDLAHQWILQVRALCHRHFTTPGGFDLHRVGPTDDRVCADPATLRRGDGTPRLSAVLRASGEVWGYPSGGEGRIGRLPQDHTAARGIQGAL
jgi:hypothetical protein